ncbi:hypothetical protein TSUD_356630 [Trifolium subterraneum]|uniref:Uncharacterized protein n=1 Tax=Trifolium subterraneum TaxID=3900 RepID=A0A2Z6NDF1_TRISU|nr:hypothetical protein TSUD_356630 [Trifolium subterraneum]
MAPSSSKSKAQLLDENKVAIDNVNSELTSQRSKVKKLEKKGKSVNLVELKEARDKEEKLEGRLRDLKDKRMELEGGGS